MPPLPRSPSPGGHRRVWWWEHCPVLSCPRPRRIALPGLLAPLPPPRHTRIPSAPCPPVSCEGCSVPGGHCSSQPSAGDDMSTPKQKLSLVLPRLGSAGHTPVTHPLCTRCVQQKMEKPLLVTARAPSSHPWGRRRHYDLHPWELGLVLSTFSWPLWGRVLILCFCHVWV